MNNKPQTKKQWQVPEIIDLDVNDTMGGKDTKTFETTSITSNAPSS